VIQIYGPGCDLGNMFITFIDTNGRDVLGPICREGFATKISQTGTLYNLRQLFVAITYGPRRLQSHCRDRL